jgi:hypothetical protein
MQQIYLIILHYILIWAEICQRKYNVKYKVYCLISVFSSLALISKFVTFSSAIMNDGWYGTGGGCFTDVM